MLLQMTFHTINLRSLPLKTYFEKFSFAKQMQHIIFMCTASASTIFLLHSYLRKNHTEMTEGLVMTLRPQITQVCCRCTFHMT